MGAGASGKSIATENVSVSARNDGTTVDQIRPRTLSKRLASPLPRSVTVVGKAKGISFGTSADPVTVMVGSLLADVVGAVGVEDDDRPPHPAVKSIVSAKTHLCSRTTDRHLWVPSRLQEKRVARTLLRQPVTDNSHRVFTYSAGELYS